MAERFSDRLLALLDELPEEKRQELLQYAEFLHARFAVPRAAADPLDIPRPEGESVVRAIKRLRASYPMLDPTSLLNETSVLVSQHVMQGRDAIEVIDELEVLFRRHFERLLRED
jgi:hypothetical protein